MVQITEDKDISVAVSAFDLCAELARLEILSDKQLEDMYGLISDFDGRIRYRAAGFINDYYLESVIAAQAKARFATSKKRKDETAFITSSKLLGLLDLIEKYSSHQSLPDYAVDALWGRSDILVSWDVMSDLLLNPGDKLGESGKRVSSLSANSLDCVLLSKFVTACVKRAAGEEIVPRTKSEPAHKDTVAQQEQNLQALTSHFIPALPKLLNKFSENSEIIAHLAQIPQYFMLDIYAKFNLDKVWYFQCLSHL